MGNYTYLAKIEVLQFSDNKDNHGSSPKTIDFCPMDYQLWARMGQHLRPCRRTASNHTEASRCCLQTLSLNPDAMHVCSYLRIELNPF